MEDGVQHVERLPLLDGGDDPFRVGTPVPVPPGDQHPSGVQRVRELRELRGQDAPDGARQGVDSHRLSAFPVCPDFAASPAGAQAAAHFGAVRRGHVSGAAGGLSDSSGRSCQSWAGTLVPYARGILRLQHVMFFNWCEAPMGASLSVLQGLISPERRKVFPALPGRCSSAVRRAVWPSGRRVPAGSIPVPCGVLSAAPLAVVVLGACPPGSCWSWFGLVPRSCGYGNSASRSATDGLGCGASRRARSTFRRPGHHCCGVSPMGGASCYLSSFFRAWPRTSTPTVGHRVRFPGVLSPSG